MDVYAALPSITGKLELEYEGELKGGDVVARELIRLAVGKVFTTHWRMLYALSDDVLSRLAEEVGRGIFGFPNVAMG